MYAFLLIKTFRGKIEDDMNDEDDGCGCGCGDDWFSTNMKWTANSKHMKLDLDKMKCVNEENGIRVTNFMLSGRNFCLDISFRIRIRPYYRIDCVRNYNCTRGCSIKQVWRPKIKDENEREALAGDRK